MRKIGFLLIPFLLILPGCAAFQVKQAKERIEFICSSLMGRSEEDVILSLGAPYRVEHISGLTIYHYYQTYGTRTNVFADNNFGNAQTWEAYDKFDLVFKNGFATSWNYNVRR